MASDLMLAFSERHGVPARLSDEGGCIFTVAGQIEVHFHVVPESAEAFFYCAVGPLSLAASAEQLVELLEANHHWQGGGGATLALDLGTLALERLVALEPLDADALAELIARTAEAVERLRRDHGELFAPGAGGPSQAWPAGKGL